MTSYLPSALDYFSFMENAQCSLISQLAIGWLLLPPLHQIHSSQILKFYITSQSHSNLTAIPMENAQSSPC